MVGGQALTHRSLYYLFLRAARSRIYRLALTLAFLLTSVGAGTGSAAPSPPGGKAPSVRSLSVRAEGERELFGMVVRDPFYEYNTDPVNFPEAPNRTALERQAAELEAAGVKWIRFEFFADYDGTVKPGDINWSKYDWFLTELAPKYNLKVLALLNVGMVSHNGQTLRPLSFNDPPDGGGSDPTDGSNHFSRVFTARAQTIAARYRGYIHAFEVVNEPNISWDLWMDSRYGSAEFKPDRYAALLTNTYRAIKNISPEVEVTTGGIMIGSPPEGQDHDHFDYLYQLYTSPWIERYRAKGYSSRPGWNTVPWDGVAVHPYFLEAPELFSILRDFARKFRDRGDYKSKIWITEIGAQAAPPADPKGEPTEQEVKQANYLRSVYGGILSDRELRSIIGHVFWFKYEDFVPGNYTHNYGLVRLLETPDGQKYNPSGQVWVRKLAYRVYQELALGYKATDRVEEVKVLAGNHIYFPETGQAIAPEFAAYWREKGEIERFGYPISRPIKIGGILSQFFQRAVFEHHPAYAGTPNEVLLRLVGNEFTRGREFADADAASLPPDKVFFPETGQSLGGSFLRFWQETGGLPVYGYPISDEVVEVSPTDGQEYVVQYFERNRFELHPDAIGTPYEVQLGLLGTNLLDEDLWWR